MYCNQCEQTAQGTGCATSPGVCGKNEDVQSLHRRDRLLHDLHHPVEQRLVGLLLREQVLLDLFNAHSGLEGGVGVVDHRIEIVERERTVRHADQALPVDAHRSVVENQGDQPDLGLVESVLETFGQWQRNAGNGSIVPIQIRMGDEDSVDGLLSKMTRGFEDISDSLNLTYPDSEIEQRKLLHENAVRFYGLE